MTERQRTVALLIDYDNLQICYSRDAPGTQLDLGAVMALAQTYGRVVVARAYAEWNLLSERLAVYKAGIEPAFAPVMRPEGSMREGKSLADTVMVSDGVDLLWTHQPDVLVLVTSDKDMIPLARIAKQRGTLVVVLGSDLTAVQLLEMANDFVTYRHLVKELGRPEEKALPARVREEPRVRRAREPFATREVAAAREASAREPRVPQSRGRPREVTSSLSLPAPAAPVVPEAPPIVAAPEPAAGFSGTLPVDEAPPLATRRRRRRGGRGRRTGLGGEELGQAGEDGFGEGQGDAEGGGGDEPIRDEVATAEPAIEAEAVPVTPVEAEVQQPERAPARRPATRRRPRPASPEQQPEPEAVSEAPAEPSAEEPAPLRPWERWPAPAQPARSGEPLAPADPVTAADSVRPSAFDSPEPLAVPAAGPVETAWEPPRDSFAPAPAIEATAEAVAPAEVPADGSEGEADSKPSPARRRVRRRPAGEAKAAPRKAPKKSTKGAAEAP